MSVSNLTETFRLMGALGHKDETRPIQTIVIAVQGTLIDYNGQVQTETQKAALYFIEQGLNVMLASTSAEKADRLIQASDVDARIKSLSVADKVTSYDICEKSNKGWGVIDKDMMGRNAAVLFGADMVFDPQSSKTYGAMLTL
jgi:hypothetical protein